MEEYPVTLYTKNDFTFTKNEPNNYSLSFYLENNHFLLAKIINFDMIKLIYDLNVDIYQDIHLNKINENEATINLLLKHLFEDAGLPQRYSYLHIHKYEQDNKIIFNGKSIKTETPIHMPADAEQAPIEDMNLEFHILTPHKLLFNCNVIFEKTMTVPAVAERLIGMILYKIFNRLKQFIDKVQL